MAESAKRVEKPWGYELWWARTDRYVGKLLHLRKGESLSLQYHRVKDETIMLQAGRLLFETRPKDENGELRKVEMKPGDVYCVMSDGVSSRGNFKTCLPGAPTDVARRIVEQWGRDHDDATALIMGYEADSLLGGEQAGQ